VSGIGTVDLRPRRQEGVVDMALCWLRLADMHDANEGRASDMREIRARA
jgi:hypothetical protein